MIEYSFTIDKAFYIEQTKTLTFVYTFNQGGNFYENYKGTIEFNLIDYVVNISPDIFKQMSGSQYTLLGDSSLLPTQLIFNTNKEIYIYTKEELGGGFIFYPGEDYTATAKAKIVTTSIPLFIIKNANEIISDIQNILLPQSSNTFQFIDYSDDNYIICSLYDSSSTGKTFIYDQNNSKWTIFSSSIFEAIKYANNTFYCLTKGKLFTTSDLGNTWSIINVTEYSSDDFVSFSVNNNQMLIVYKVHYTYQTCYDLLLSNDAGITWKSISIPYSDICDTAIINNRIYVLCYYWGLFYNGLYFSDDQGLNWTKSNIPISEDTLIHSNNEFLLWSGKESKLYRFENNIYSIISIPSGGLCYEVSSQNALMYYDLRNKGYYINTSITNQNSWYFIPKEEYFHSVALLDDKIVALNGNNMECYILLTKSK